MRVLRTVSVAVAVAALGVAGSLYAGPDDKDKDKKDVTVPMEKAAKLSPAEMSRSAGKVLTGMQTQLKKIVKLQKVARKQKDVIKLNCVNDKLLQVKQLLNIAESARTNMIEAIANQNDGDRYHQYGQMTISKDKVNVLRGEAEACVGDELSFVGPTKIDVDSPDIVDDPTKKDPFAVLNTPEIERPAFASPFL